MLRNSIQSLNSDSIDAAISRYLNIPHKNCKLVQTKAIRKFNDKNVPIKKSNVTNACAIVHLEGKIILTLLYFH